MPINSLKNSCKELELNLDVEIQKIDSLDLLENFRIKYLGKAGLLTELLNQLKSLSLEGKKELGPILNNLKQLLKTLIEKKNQQLLEVQISQASKLKTGFDVTAYKSSNYGSLHIYSQVLEFVENIFISMGFEIIKGPEVETDLYNFEALNIPADHPARDIQDTFWLTIPHLLMRTHTSSVEVHIMKNRKPPFAIVAPGRCFRNEATDASHDFQFMQLEGLFVDKHVSLSNLAATVKTFLQAFFEKKNISIRLRPSYYPFVEPGLDVDMECPFCETGCNICKKTRWIEIAGAGLTHPNVLNFCGIDSRQYTGFAFGFGLTRLVMLKYNINDIRLLHSNKIDFLKQF